MPGEPNSRCIVPPASQHVSKLPEGFGDGQHTVTASGSAPLYFLDLYFYDAEYTPIGSFASFAPDETSRIPSRTAYLFTANAYGAEIAVDLLLKDTA